MILDLNHDPIPEFSADVCIVGAGAAGLALAVELLKKNKRVLLLESGGLTLEAAAQSLNQCKHIGQPHQGANIGRFRTLGGTTTAWGGQILELTPEDFAPRSWIPGSGWPFTKEEITPYYQRALHTEGIASATQNDEDLWRQMKISPPNLGRELTPYFTRWCPEPNFARLYREAFHSPHLYVVLHATATRMQLSQEGAYVRGIECTAPSGRQKIFYATQYVLALGTIESIRFLLQPQPGTQTPPWNRSGLLGRHFQSHIDINAAHIPAADAAHLHPWFANAYRNSYKYHPKFRLAATQQQQDQILNIAGSITCINPAEAELRRVKLVAGNLLRHRKSSVKLQDIPRALRQLPTMLRLAYGYRIRHRAAWPQGSAFWLRVHCEQEPLSHSSITLTPERDATGLFRAQWDWRISLLEWQTIRTFTQRVQTIFSAHNLANIAPRSELQLADGFRKLTFDDSHHHMGGARMSISAAQGVVDPTLRLHGLQNMYLCSAATFPTSGFSNPTHTLIALALRLADHLAAPSAAMKAPHA